MHPTTRLLAAALAAVSGWAVHAQQAPSPQPPAAQQPAARVLVVAGTAFLERAGQRQPLERGAAVENGDAVEVGDASAVQLRFSDESIVALRARSLLKVQDYRYSGVPEQDRSILGLLRGGMRTITGLIGKSNPRAYAVTNVLATVGIRGTHFTLVSCQNDCGEAEGQPVPNGLFGGVTDGRISVTNEAGEAEFGQQDYFHVMSATAPPQRLLAPPGVLNDRTLVVRARPAGAPPAAAAEDDGGRSGGAQVSTSPQPAKLQLLSGAALALRAALTSTERESLTQLLSNLQAADITAMFARSGTDPQGVFPYLEFKNMTVAQVRQSLEEVSDKTFTNAATLAAQLSLTRTVSGAPAAGLYWSHEPPDPGNPLGNHVVWGDTPRVSMPASGVATYNYVGGTAPTDNFGRTGTLSAGRLSMDFSAQQVKTVDPITLAFAGDAAKAPGVSYTITPGNTWSMGGGSQNLSQITCSGCNGTTQGMVWGRLTGLNMQGYAAAFALTGSIGTALPHLMGVGAAFGRQ